MPRESQHSFTRKSREVSDDAEPGAKLWLRRVVGIVYGVGMVVVPIVLLAVLATGLVYVRLSHGPVSLKVFAPPIERGISAELGDLAAHIDDVQLRFSEAGTLEFRLINLSISEPDGDRVATAPLAAVTLSPSALWFLRAIPERVELIEPRLSLHYSREQGLSLSFEESANSEAPEGVEDGDGQQRPVAPLPREAIPRDVPAPKPALRTTLRRLDFARLLARSSARARRGETATSYLREIGLKDASVTVDYAGKMTEWKVPEIGIDLEHMSRRSVISGLARIASDRGPWTLTFRTEDSDKTQEVSLKASVRDLVPSALGQALPDLALFNILDLPIAGDASVELSTSGVLKAATLALELGRGRVVLQPSAPPLLVDAGLLHLDYAAEQRILTLAPSTVRWGDSHITLAGNMTGTQGADKEIAWDFSVEAKDGVMAAEEFKVSGIPVDRFSAHGQIVPHEARARLSDFVFKAGGAEIKAEGELSTESGAESVRLDVATGPMPIETAKVLWPRAAAAEARHWVGTSIVRGTVGAGTVRLTSGRFSETGAAAATKEGAPRLTAAFEIASAQAILAEGAIPVDLPRTLVRVENDLTEITVPDAAVLSPSAKRIPLKNLRLAVTAADEIGTSGRDTPSVEMSLRTQSPLQPVLEIVQSLPDAPALPPDLPLDGIEGKVDAQFVVKAPIEARFDPSAVRLTGKAKITDLKSKQKLQGYEIQGGSVEIDATEAAIQAKGDFLVNSVLAKVDWQRILDAPADKQPPLRITANLDNADRIQLGLDVNHLVQGEVPVEVTVARAPAGDTKVSVRGDLTNAEISLRDLAWKKPAGRAAFVEFDVGKGRTQNLELQNFKVSGDNVAIEGWLAIDNEKEVREFYFPDFSLNVVSRLEVQGTLDANRVWKLKAKGATFDGRDFFKALVSLGPLDEQRIRPRRPCAGIDLDADIDTILGHNEVALRNVKVSFSERNDKISAIEMHAVLDGGKPLAVALNSGQTPRTVYADSTDAGQALKLVGFYPNMQGGRVRLEVNLDGRGAAEKAGILWIDDFRVLGDPVVSEVFSSAPEAKEGGSAQNRKVVREVFEFTRMRVPFSAGHGQFVLEDSYLRGPVLGATISGKLDHVQKRMSLGGTYVPLQGINSALCEIPLFGPIFTGSKCEGLLGITYAIQGSMDKPQVIVNPFSIVAPGIFREIFQMTNPNPKVVPREDPSASAPVKSRTRDSSSDVMRGESKFDGGAAAQNGVDGWSSSGATKN